MRLWIFRYLKEKNMFDVTELIKKVGEKEAAITEQEFVSPIFFNEYVATKIFGIVYKFKIEQKTPGWYKVKPVDHSLAKTSSIADLSDIDFYLSKLTKIRLTLTLKRKNVYLAVPEKSNNLNLPIEQLIPVFLFDDYVMDFDRIIARFDGSNFWYHQIDPSHDPAKSAYLREKLNKRSSAKTIKFSGLTTEDRIAYILSLTLTQKEIIDKKKDTIKQDIEHAGGELIKFLEKSDHYRVTYKVDGHEYTSNISKTQDHKVITAGICLSGEDRKYDLKSLITVMREGQQTGRIYRLNNV